MNAPRNANAIDKLAASITKMAVMVVVILINSDVQNYLAPLREMMTPGSNSDDFNQFLSNRAAARLLLKVVNATMVTRLTGIRMAAITGESCPPIASDSPNTL